jgi:hypothetical protein
MQSFFFRFDFMDGIDVDFDIALTHAGVPGYQSQAVNEVEAAVIFVKRDI